MELVEGALAMPASTREAWLAARCPDDPELLAEVLDRVAWEEKMGDFLRDPIVARPVSRAETFAPGALLAGRYRIAREIGRGRWSVVLQALDTATQRTVAIKLATRAQNFANPPQHPALPCQYEYAEVETLEGPAGFAVVEYLEGPSLSRSRHEAITFSATEARGLALRLCQVLLHAIAAGFQPASLNAGDVILAARGPILICDWLATGGKATSDSANLASLGLILRHLPLRPDEPDARNWDLIVRRCLGQVPATRYASLGALERDLLSRRGRIGHIVRRLMKPFRGVRHTP